MKKLIPFNLDKALAGAKVVTRDGKVVSQLHLFSGPVQYPLVGVTDDSSDREVHTFTINGRYNCATPPLESSNDLFIEEDVEVEQTGYVNVWLSEDFGFPLFHATTHYSLQQAENERKTSCSGRKKTLITRLEFKYFKETLGLR